MEKRAIFIIILGAAAMAATNFFLRGKIIGSEPAILLLLTVSAIIFLIGIFSLIYIFIKKLRGE